MGLGNDYIPTKEEMEQLAQDKNMTIEQVTGLLTKIKSKPTKSVSCRVNSFIRFNYKCENKQHKLVDYFPLSSVIEAGMIYFLTLNNDDRINFLKENSASNVKVKDLKELDIPFETYINNIIEDNYIPKEVYKKMSIEDKIKTACHILQKKKEANK